MDVRSMDYILAIAEQGSLSTAAHKLGVSQPTLSIFLSRLETELGTDLFYREKKHLVPTPAGRIYLEAARRIVQVRDQTYQAIYQMTHEQRETITVGATPLRGSVLMAQVFPVFHRRFPEIRMQIREGYTGELRELVRRREVNLALGSCFDNECSTLDYAIFSKEEILIGLPSFHRLAPRALAEPGYPQKLASLPIAELADTPFVLLAKGNTLREISDALFAQAGIAPPVIFETNNNLVLVNMVRRGAGAGLIARSAMNAEADDIVYFSLQPRYYMNLTAFLPKARRLTLPERYLLYLFIRQDRNNPLYLPSLNTRAQIIWDEFESQEGAL